MILISDLITAISHRHTVDLNPYRLSSLLLQTKRLKKLAMHICATHIRVEKEKQIRII